MFFGLTVERGVMARNAASVGTARRWSRPRVRVPGEAGVRPGRITNAVGWDVAGCGISLRPCLLPAASPFPSPRLPTLSGK